MSPSKLEKLLAVFSCVGLLMTTVLLFIMLHLARQFPEIEELARNVRIVGALLAVWLAVTAFFTVRAYQNGKNQNKK